MSQDLDKFIQEVSRAKEIVIPNKRFFANLSTIRSTIQDMVSGNGLNVRVNHHLPPDMCAFTDDSGQIIGMLSGVKP